MLRLAFGGSEQWSREYFDPQKNPRLDLEQVMLVEEEGEIRASTTVLPMEVFVDGVPRPMGGIAAVMTDPAYRRRGYAKRLLEENIADMRRRGVHLSMLDPFSHSFYRKLGWETAFDTIHYTLSPKKLPTSDEQRHIRTHRAGDEEGIREIFEAEAVRHQVCLRRGDGRWKKLFSEVGDADDGRQLVVHDAGDGAEGYAMYAITSLDGDREPYRRLGVELVCSSRRAKEGLHSFLAAFDAEEFDVSLTTPRGEPLHPYLDESHVKMELYTGLMLRIVDVEGALGYLEREIPEPLVLEVSDDVIPENNGEFTVGEGEVRRGARTGHRVRLDVRQLSQLYAGYLSGRSLAGVGLIEADSGDALDLLEAYLPAGDPFVFPGDHF